MPRPLAPFLAVMMPALIAAPAAATPAPGDVLPTVAIVDLDGKSRALPDPSVAVIVIYEDDNAGSQNARASSFIDKITDLPVNRGKVEALPVADLAKWNWWPAKKYALAEVKKIAARELTTIYLDWSAAVRKAWKLQKGRSGIIVLDKAGTVRFAAEGPLSEAQIGQLLAAVTALGATVPDLAGVRATVRHDDVKEQVPEQVKTKFPDARE
jgi:hypothetical protein